MEFMTTIAFIGAGSVVFTRQLLADLFALPRARRATIALHDIDPERLEHRRGIARRSWPSGAAPTDHRRHLGPARRPRRRRLRDQHGPGRRHRGDPSRLRGARPYGLRQTIGDTLGVGGIFRALRTFPVLAGIAADMREVCPDAWLLNYTNPMAMNIW